MGEAEAHCTLDAVKVIDYIPEGEVSCQKIQGLGGVSPDVLYLPRKCQGLLVHLNSGARLRRPSSGRQPGAGALLGHSLHPRWQGPSVGAVQQSRALFAHSSPMGLSHRIQGIAAAPSNLCQE